MKCSAPPECLERVDCAVERADSHFFSSRASSFLSRATSPLPHPSGYENTITHKLICVRSVLFRVQNHTDCFPAPVLFSMALCFHFCMPGKEREKNIGGVHQQTHQASLSSSREASSAFKASVSSLVICAFSCLAFLQSSLAVARWAK